MERDPGVRGTDAATGILAAIGAGFGRATEWADSCGAGDLASDVSTLSCGRAAHCGQHSGPEAGGGRAWAGDIRRVRAGEARDIQYDKRNHRNFDWDDAIAEHRSGNGANAVSRSAEVHVLRTAAGAAIGHGTSAAEAK